MNRIIKVYNSIPKNIKRSLLRFFLSFFIAWFIAALFSDFPFFAQHIENSGIDQHLQSILVWLTEHQLNLLGFSTYSEGEYLQIMGCNGIRYAYSCLGIRHFILFSVFIMAYFGPFIKKLIYISIGCTILLLLNSIRGTIISIGQYIKEETTLLVHDISTPILMYTAILLLWIFWVNKQLNK